MNNRIRLNIAIDKGFRVLGLVFTLFGFSALIYLFFDVFKTGLSRIDFSFFTSLPSRFPEKAGILTAWTGTVWVMVLTSLIAIPVGIFTGIYLEEYLKKGRLSNILEINIANLAGIPSVIYGILGLELFSRFFHLGPSVLAGSLTLALLILPIIVVATREAIKAIPKSLREASYALGASKWQTIWHQILPASINSILTGIILSISRAIGETAPLIVVGALAYVPFVAKTPMDDFTVMPMQIFNWISRPQHGFLVNSAAAIIVLLFIVIILNGIAVYLRKRTKIKFT